MSNYFNEDLKERYINSFKDNDTKNSLTSMFSGAARTEKFYNKDIYDFTVDQIKETMHDLAHSSPNATYNKVLKIENYIDWAIENGYRKSNINLLNAISGKRAWAMQFVSTRKNVFFSKNDIMDMADLLVNEVDKAVLLGLFEGINGTGFSEFINLMMKDLTETNGQYLLKLKNEYDKNGITIRETRTIQVTKKLAKALEGAYKQDEYINKNGESIGDERHRTTEIERSEFIINKTKKGKQGGRPDKSIINRKINDFKNIFGYKFLKADHIRKSGIMSMANDLQVDGVLSRESLEKISAFYDTWNEEMSRQEKYKSEMRMKDVLASESFNEVYEYSLKLE